MALISANKFAINPINTNGCNGNNGKTSSQCNYYSQTSLLSARVEFKSAKEHSSDSSEDEDIAKRLKSKYHVLLPDSTSEKAKPMQFNVIGGHIQLPSKLTKKPNDLHNQKPNNKDGNELGQPKLTLFPREKINALLEWKKANKIGSGLANLGNTCFLNSVLQCLTYCPPLANYLNLVKDEHVQKCRLQFCMICLMMKHVSNALSRSLPVLKPLPFCQRLKSIAKHFTFGRQEDAHECLRYVIDHMCRSCLSIHENELGAASKFDHLTKSTTAINQIFGGYHRSQVLCLNCKEKSNTYDYFMDFMLDIQNVSSLQDALAKFVTPETLSHDNAYKCSKCKKSVSARKQFTVYREPNVATFQFKRFDCTRMFGKISKPVSYPEKLDLRPYMSEKGRPPVMYKLNSVLVHLGASSNSGHYYCYVRNSNDCWYLMDDSHVSQVSLNEVLNQKAYVLFYVRCTDGVQQKMQQKAQQAVPQKIQQHVQPVQQRVQQSPVQQIQPKVQQPVQQKVQSPVQPKVQPPVQQPKQQQQQQLFPRKLVPQAVWVDSPKPPPPQPTPPPPPSSSSSTSSSSNQRERSHHHRKDESEEEETELKWVERTKETVEMERKSSLHRSNDQSEKRKLHSEKTENSTEEASNKKMKLPNEGHQKKFLFIDALLKSRGYGDDVKSWSGGMSNLNRSISDDLKKSASFDQDDEYNEEFDQGKTKKIKKPLDKVDLFRNNSVNFNPFQRMQVNKYSGHHQNQNGSQKNNNFGRNSYNNPSSKFNGGNKPHHFNGKFGGGGRHNDRSKYFDKHKDRRFSRFNGKNGGGGGGGHNSQHNRHHYRSNSSNSGHHKKNKFKHH